MRFFTIRTNRKVCRTRDNARANVSDYIERFCNPRSRHSIAGYLSPMEFEACRADARRTSAASGVGASRTQSPEA